jgi:hypothetical protein
MPWPSSGAGGEQVEYRCAKFHLVDLAGSERTKRTGAVGARFKETVTINQVGGCTAPASLYYKLNSKRPGHATAAQHSVSVYHAVLLM